MRTLGLLMARNMRKRRGQAIAMLLLALLGAALMNLGLIMATAYGPHVDSKLAEANAAEASSLVYAGAPADRVVAALGEATTLRALDVEPTLFAVVDTMYEGKSTSTSVIIANHDAPPTMGTWRTVRQLKDPVASPIWAPQIYDTAGGYDLGDPVSFSTPSGSVTFHIQGFIEHPTLGMPSMGALGFAVPADEYAALAAASTAGLRPTELIKVQAKPGVDATDVLQQVMVAHDRAHPDDRVRSLIDSSTSLMRAGATIGSSIFAGGFVVFAVIILVVALVVMRFLLVNAIADDLRSLGVLRAFGFSTGAVMRQLAGTFALSALAGSALGVGFSYLVLPSLTGSLSDQTGLVWSPGFHAVIGAATVVLLTGIVFVVALLAARRLRTQSTIEAMNGGAKTHNFTRNPLPLQSTNGRLNVLLGLKAALRRLPQQALVGATVGVVAFTTMIAMGMSLRLLGDEAAFMRLVIGDVPDAQLVVRDASAAPAVMADAAATAGVERAFLSAIDGVMVNGRQATVQVMDDYSILRYDSTYSGRMPRHADEAALGSTMADRLHVGVGDRVTLDIGGYTAEYLVSGLTSTSRGLGMTVDVTTDGMRRADPNYQQRVVALHIADGQDIDRLITDLAKHHAAEVEAPINVKSSLAGQLSGYRSMVDSLAAVIVVFMVIVVVLVVALIVSTMIVQSRRSYGVLKAVGFSTADLRRQTQLTWLPVIAVGAVVGAVLGVVGLDPTVGAMLRFVGIARADLNLGWEFVPVLAAAVVVLAAVVVRIVAGKLKRVSAYALVTE